MSSDPSTVPFSNVTIRVVYVNFWDSGRKRLDAVVDGLGLRTTTVQPDAYEYLFAQAMPDIVVIGFASRSRAAATFLANFKSSPWFRRVPLLALVDSRDDSNLWRCIEWGCDDAILKPIGGSHLLARIRLWTIRHRQRERERKVADGAILHARRAAAFAEIIVPLGVAMMAETDFDVLLSTILAEARGFCHAEGGTIYLINDADALEFKTVVNESLGIGLEANGKPSAELAAIPLNRTNEEEITHVASYVAITGMTVNIADVYVEKRFDMSGAKAFDKAYNYRTHSLLTIALRDRLGRIIGVLQLVNGKNSETGEYTPFSSLDQTFIESLSRMAGQALESYRKMARLRRQANALVVHIDNGEKAKQVESITSSEYFKTLKARAKGLRDTTQPQESAVFR